MALTLQTSLKNALADTIDAQIGTAGYMEITTSGDTELRTFTFGNPAFGDASNGTITLNGTPLSDSDTPAGTAAKFRIFASGAVLQLEGVVAVSGQDLDLSSLTIGANDTVELTSFSITVP